MFDFKFLAWLSLDTELGRNVNYWLLWASALQPRHITGWKLPSMSKGLKVILREIVDYILLDLD